MVAEEIDEVPDEGYDRFIRELAAALARRCTVLSQFTPTISAQSSPFLRVVKRMRAVWRAAKRGDLEHYRPRVVLYASANPVSGPSLLRARLLRIVARAPVAMMVIQPNQTSAVSRLLLRAIPPDLLVVGTAAECREARSLGIESEVIWSGVDSRRFRPPEDGEREDLRRRYGIPLEDRVVLHVGHLHDSRNLMALAPLAAQPGVLVLVVASRRAWAETERLRLQLEASGIRVMRGYQPRVEELYRLADCYVFPSSDADHAIALPLSVLEAASSGLPAVCMRFRALPEQLEGTAGVELVDREEELTERVLAAMASPPAARPVAATFSWDGVAERMLQSLGSLNSLDASPGARSQSSRF
jgi:glycosyltransferase involved in cell wall biosynthesis